MIGVREALLLTVLTLAWGLNWPIMKVSIASVAPLSFRTLSMWLGLPVLLVVMLVLKAPLGVPRRHWRELAVLTATNMLVWYVLMMVSLQSLSSGRAAILGYTMPVFSALLGMGLYGQRLALRQWAGIGAAAFGVGLLLWHELGTMAGQPWAAIGMLVAAATWALGTQQLRHTRVAVPTLTLVFWMTLLTMVVMTVISAALEHDRWSAPAPVAWFGLIFNAVIIIGIAQPIWLILARSLPPIASTLSVMLIPVLGTLAGAWWLGEQLHWQDGAALGLILAAIGSVLWPARAPRQA